MARPGSASGVYGAFGPTSCLALTRQRAAPVFDQQRAFLCAQESNQRTHPTIRPGTLRRTRQAGGAELAALRHAAPRVHFESSGLPRPPQGANKREAKVQTDGVPAPLHNIGPNGGHAPGARSAGAAREGRRSSVPTRPERPAHIHRQCLRDRDCLDLRAPFVAPSGEGFRGKRGAACLSGAEGAASSAPPAKALATRETPARTAGRGRGSRVCFLVTSLHKQRSNSRRAGESAPGRTWDRRHRKHQGQLQVQPLSAQGVRPKAP